MRIGIDCRTILNPSGGERAGVGHYTYYLVKNLLSIDKINHYVLFFDNRFTGVDEFKSYNNITIRFFPFYQYKKYLPLAYSQLLISAVLKKEKLDVFHSPANIIPLKYHKPSVITVHDLGIYKFPQFFPKEFLGKHSFSTKVLVPKSLKNAKKIIAVSKNTKKDIVEQFGISEDKVEVIYEGVLDNKEICAKIADFNQLKTKYGITGKFILFLGTIEPRKNIVGIVHAFRTGCLMNDSPLKDYQLIIAGGHGWLDQPIYQAIFDANASILGIKEKRGVSDRRKKIDWKKIKEFGERRKGDDRRGFQPIKYIGYISHEDKMALLSHTECFVFPSFYEGFGLPVLEAMSLGAPVITSNTSSLPEVAGEGNAILVNPEKESEITDALIKIAGDQILKETLIKNGHQRSKDFSWKLCAKKTIAVYNSVYNQKK